MKKKNVIGALVMAGMILVSVPFGANRSLNRLREETRDEAYYYDSTGYAIYEGLEKQQAAARNLITVAERYVESNPGLDPYLDELTYRADFCEKFYDPGDPKEAESYGLLVEAARGLSGQLEGIRLNEKDEKYPRQLIAEIESEQDKLERSSYNDEAREFNETLTRFPASLLGELTGVKELGVFGQ